MGLLAQEGQIGEAANKFGEFALGAFEVVGVVAATSEVPAKVAKNVGEEFLEVVEFTSAAATKVSKGMPRVTVGERVCACGCKTSRAVGLYACMHELLRVLEVVLLLGHWSGGIGHCTSRVCEHGVYLVAPAPVRRAGVVGQDRTRDTTFFRQGKAKGGCAATQCALAQPPPPPPRSACCM